MKRIGLLISIIMTMTLLSSCGTSVGTLTGDQLTKTANSNLQVQGNVETKEIDLNSKMAGKITAVKVSEGDQVKAGQVLFVIDNATIIAKKAQVEAQIAAATGQMNAAQAAQQAASEVLKKAQNGARPQEIAQAKAGYDEAAAGYNYALTTYNRVKALYDGNAATKADLDQATTALEVQKQTMQIQKQVYDMAKSGARNEDKAAAQAQVTQAQSMVSAAKGQILQAKGGLEEVQSYLDDTVIKAPADGIMETVNVEPGELVSTGMPVATMTTTVAPWVEVSVKETDLSKVSLGQQVNVKLLAYPNETFKGKIVRINEKPDFAVKRATNDNGEFDVLAYGVKVELTGIGKQLHPGMTAIVDFGKKSDK